MFLVQWLLGRSHLAQWSWGEAYIQDAAGRLRRLLAEAKTP